MLFLGENLNKQPLKTDGGSKIINIWRVFRYLCRDLGVKTGATHSLEEVREVIFIQMPIDGI
jgi:hypothetical protein